MQNGWSFQEQGILVKPANESRIQAQPGKIITVSFSVTNATTSKQQYEARLVLPAGWRAFVKETPFELSANQSDIRLVSFFIASETPAGQYEVQYSVKDNAVPLHIADGILQVTISAVRQIELKLLESPRFVVAGAPYKSTFLLTNKGNTYSSVRLSVNSPNDFPVQLDSSRIHLAPKENRSIVIQVTTDAELTEKIQHAAELVGVVEQDSLITVRATSAVEVISRASNAIEQYQLLPLLAKLRFVGEKESPATQLEISGSTSLTEDRKDRLNLLIRTPDTQTRSILGQRDEYYLGYQREGYELYFGDRNFSLSPLTEFGRYGFGAGGKITVQDVSVGGFYNESRFIVPQQKEYAGFLSYKVREGTELGVNYLKKNDPKESDIVTVRSLVKLFTNTDVDVEYGVGSSGNTKDDAYSARINGREKWISYDVRYVRANPQYPGYFKDLDFKTVSLNIIPMSGLRVEAYARDEQRNLRLRQDTMLFYAPRDQYYQLGVGYSDFLSMYYRINVQEDRLPNSKYNRSEEMIQIRAGYNFPSINFLVNADLGTTTDKLLQKDSPSRRYSLSTNFRPIDNQSYGLSVEYSKDQNLFNDETQERLSASFSMWVLLGARTQLTASFYGSKTSAEVEQTYSLIEIALEHAFPFGHKIAMRGRETFITPATEGREIAYSAEYSIPLNIPLARLKNAGQLRGKVIDVETGKGTENVLLYVGGATAVTDRLGEFFFPALKPETQFLQIDMSTIGLNRVPSQPMPKEVVIRGGEEARVDIGVVRSATVSGVITLHGFAKTETGDSTAGPIVELGGHPSAVLELSNGVEVNRRVADNRGRFVFADIRPGKWKLQVIDGNLPEFHFLEKDAIELELQPGMKEEVSFKVLPRKRKILILQEGKVLEAGKPAEQKKPTVTPTQPVQKQSVTPTRPKKKRVEQKKPAKSKTQPKPKQVEKKN